MLTDLIPDVRQELHIAAALAGLSLPEFTDQQIIEALEEGFLLEQIGDKIPAGATPEERAKNADLVTFGDDVAGANCRNCEFFSNDYCTHQKVQQSVTERMCCSFWNRPGTMRSWEQAPTTEAVPAFEPQVPMPDLRQSESYDCGAAVMRAACDYFGCEVTPDTEKEFIELLGTSPADGTSPAEMVAFAVRHGLRVHASGSMSIDDLRDCLERGMPILCPIQSGGNAAEQEAEESGHWIAVIGAKDEMILLQDPIAGRVYLTVAEFDHAWHDQDAHGREFSHWGVALGK